MSHCNNTQLPYNNYWFPRTHLHPPPSSMYPYYTPLPSTLAPVHFVSLHSVSWVQMNATNDLLEPQHNYLYHISHQTSCFLCRRITLLLFVPNWFLRNNNIFGAILTAVDVSKGATRVEVVKGYSSTSRTLTSIWTLLKCHADTFLFVKFVWPWQARTTTTTGPDLV